VFVHRKEVWGGIFAGLAEERNENVGGVENVAESAKNDVDAPAVVHEGRAVVGQVLLRRLLQAPSLRHLLSIEVVEPPFGREEPLSK